MSRILVVDDEPKSVKMLRLRLEEAGHTLRPAHSFAEAVREIGSEILDLVITDVRLPDGQGTELVTCAHKLQPGLPVIIMTAYGTIRDAVQAMQLGAVEYVQKPFELEAMALLAERVLENAAIRAEHGYLLEETHEGRSRSLLVGNSAAMAHVRELVAKVAATRTTVLLLGESGTGKELAAQAIHELSVDRDQPLVKVNCPGIPPTLFESELFGHVRGSFTGATGSRKGRFELAGAGNVLLDEIGEIPPELQSKLLRVLEDRRFTPVGGTAEVPMRARVIAATNQDLKKAVDEGRFRQDLFFRLNVFPITLPPLRDRREDLPELCRHLLATIHRTCRLRTTGISDAALGALGAYDWPGNVRELRNVLERAAVLADGEPIEVEHLPLEIQEAPRCPTTSDGMTFQDRLDRFKETTLLEALQATRWSKKDAAARLGLSQRAFSYYVSRYDLDRHRE